MKANYYAHLKSPHLLNAEENKDGTVNLSDDRGNVLVTNCPLADAPTIGHAVLVKEKDAAPEKEPKKEGGKKDAK